MKNALFLLIIEVLIELFSINSARADINFRIQGATSWDYGWKDQFFFQTITWGDALKGNFDFDRVMQTTRFPECEITYNFPLSKQFNGGIGIRYGQWSLTAEDSVSLSFIRWLKTMDANFQMISLTGQIKYSYKRMSPFINMSIGHVHGKLETQHLFQSPGHPESKKFVRVKGNANSNILDIRFGSTYSLNLFSILFYLGYSYTGSMKFDTTEIGGDIDETTKFLIQSDRQLNPVYGPYIGLGLEFRIK